MVAINDPLVIYTIYRNPTDYPGKYVVRRWLVDRTGVHIERVVAVRNSLATARSAVPPELACIQRQADDDPVIVETWI